MTYTKFSAIKNLNLNLNVSVKRNFYLVDYLLLESDFRLHWTPPASGASVFHKHIILYISGTMDTGTCVLCSVDWQRP